MSRGEKHGGPAEAGRCIRSRERRARAEIRNRAVRVQEIVALLIYPADSRPDLLFRMDAAADVAAHRVDVASVQPLQAIEVARVAAVHRVRDRLDGRARLEAAALEISRHDVVGIRGRDKGANGRAGATRHDAGGEVAEVAAGYGEERSAEASRY